jgi:predicted DNA-binding transcriptional regulator AlpA
MRRASIVLPVPEDTRHALEHVEVLEIQLPRLETCEAWVKRVEAAAPSCACGCGERIVVGPRHRAKGLPKYAHGHHSNSIRRVHAKLRAQGYVLLGEACRRLGMSETSFRRLESAKRIPKARRIEAWSKRSVRVLTEQEIEALEPKIAAWRAQR